MGVRKDVLPWHRPPLHPPPCLAPTCASHECAGPPPPAPPGLSLPSNVCGGGADSGHAMWLQGASSWGALEAGFAMQLITKAVWRAAVREPPIPAAQSSMNGSTQFKPDLPLPLHPTAVLKSSCLPAQLLACCASAGSCTCRTPASCCSLFMSLPSCHHSPFLCSSSPGARHPFCSPTSGCNAGALMWSWCTFQSSWGYPWQRCVSVSVAAATNAWLNPSHDSPALPCLPPLPKLPSTLLTGGCGVDRDAGVQDPGHLHPVHGL